LANNIRCSSHCHPQHSCMNVDVDHLVNSSNFNALLSVLSTRAVVREFADGTGAVLRVPRPPPEKFMHGTPARTPGADRHSVCVPYMEFGSVFCSLLRVLLLRTRAYKKTKLL